jgi:hypothetical protein
MMMTGMRISRYVSFSNINMSSWLPVLTPLGMAGLQYHLTKNFISFSFYDFFLQEHSGADRILDSYNDLCVLYGNSMAVGRASHKGVKMGFDNNEFDMGIDGVFGDAPYQNLKYLTKGRNEILFLPQWWCLQGKLADTGKERLKKHLVRNQW